MQVTDALDLLAGPAPDPQRPAMLELWHLLGLNEGLDVFRGPIIRRVELPSVLEVVGP